MCWQQVHCLLLLQLIKLAVEADACQRRHENLSVDVWGRRQGHTATQMQADKEEEWEPRKNLRGAENIQAWISSYRQRPLELWQRWWRQPHIGCSTQQPANKTSSMHQKTSAPDKAGSVTLWHESLRLLFIALCIFSQHNQNYKWHSIQYFQCHHFSYITEADSSSLDVWMTLHCWNVNEGDDGRAVLRKHASTFDSSEGVPLQIILEITAALW